MFAREENMDIFEALETRRSIRKYSADPVGDEDVKKCLEMAMLAPSACNEQPWQFVVVRSEAGRNALAATTPYTHMAAQAQVVVVVCGDMDKDKAGGMWVQDCAAATQNFMLAARGLNIGTVWCGIHPRPEREAHVRQALNLPERIVPFGMICAGHPAGEFKAESRYAPSLVHLETW